MNRAAHPGRAAAIGRSRRLRGAEQVVAVMQQLAARGESVVGAVLSGEAEPKAWQHFPHGDARDPGTGFRWYYHCHDRQPAGEHGHFHLFAELPASGSPEGHALAHLIAIGVDARGQPRRAFTVNHWVTGNVWLPAAECLRRLARFAVAVPAELGAIHRWLGGMLALFAPQISAVIEARDARLALFKARGLRPGLLEDRRTEMLSQQRLSLRREIAALAAT